MTKMCQLLKVSRANIYKYQPKEKTPDVHVEQVKRIFNDHQKAYGTRRIKAQLQREGVCLSRRRIARIMKQERLVSTYTKAHYRVPKATCNEAKIENIVNRQFTHRQVVEVVVSDLTYVRVGKKWNYICTLLDLHNREIIGYSIGANKDAELVERAFAKVQRNLGDISIFHTDRGKEFDNQRIERILDQFQIKRSLSKKGTPYDNAVAEATYKTIKTEFIYPQQFETKEELKKKFGAYVWWYNHKRLHSTLGYIPPIEYQATVSL